MDEFGFNQLTDRWIWIWPVNRQTNYINKKSKKYNQTTKIMIHISDQEIIHMVEQAFTGAYAGCQIILEAAITSKYI